MVGGLLALTPYGVQRRVGDCVRSYAKEILFVDASELIDYSVIIISW